MQYYGGGVDSAKVCYVVQEQPAGLCDAIFQALPLIKDDEPVVMGLPDTVWFPTDGLARLGNDGLSFLCFPVKNPHLFDAVLHDEEGRVQEIQVKRKDARSNWIWGAIKAQGRVLHELHALWLERKKQDEYLGTLVNAWIARGGQAFALRAGESYVDVGTLNGYRDAMNLLRSRS
ncbi:MAG: sugar phosphate nucleotidyltransferase [Myxococcales bacterium]